jgi:hypothetical protein
MPLSIVLAVDTSGSVYNDLKVEKRAAHDFVHGLLRQDLTVSVDRGIRIRINNTRGAVSAVHGNRWYMEVPQVVLDFIRALPRRVRVKTCDSLGHPSFWLGSGCRYVCLCGECEYHD